MRQHLRNVLAFLFLTSVSVAGLAADERSIGLSTVAELQRIFDESAVSSGVVGAQASIIVGDERVELVYGKANTEQDVPMTVDTIMQVGSVTKVFNAALIMTLVDEGKLALDVPVIRYIPDLKLSDAQAQQKLTLRHLISMSSGVDGGPYIAFSGDDALAKYVGLLADLPQAYEPGKGFGYSNGGICIAGYAAQRVTGIGWDALLQQQILDPAGLTHAATLPQNYPYQRVSLGYTPSASGQATVNRPWVFSQGQAPAGSTLTMSAHDLASFGKLFVSGGKAENGKQVLSGNAVKMMMTPTTTVPIAIPVWGVGSAWGLGPNTAKWGDTVVWGHGGSNQNGMSQLIWIPEKGAVLAFVANTPAAYEPLTARMFSEFTRAAFGISLPKLAAPAKPLLLKNPVRYVGNYVRLGMRYEVTVHGGQLHYKQTSVAGMAPESMLKAGVMIDADLIPLGGDRFLAKLPAPRDPMPIAFFGDDGRGRTTAVADPLAAAARVK